MISNYCTILSRKYRLPFPFKVYNSYIKQLSLDSIPLNRFSFDYHSTILNGHPFAINGYKSSFTSSSQSFIDTKVEFKHLSIPDGYITNLKSLGIKDLRLFQYIIFKVLKDNLTLKNDPNISKKFLRLVFYNELGSGQSIGALLPLIYLYSYPKFREEYMDSSRETPTGSLLVLCSRSSCTKILNLLLGINPSMKCLLLDKPHSGHEGPNSIQPGGNFGNDSGDILSRVLKDNILSTEGSYEVILASHKTLPSLSQRRRGNFPLLSTVSCVLFDDFSEVIESDIYLFTQNLNLVKESKKANTSDSESNMDFHVVCLINSLGDKFQEYSTKNLYNYSLYDFKYGTKQRLLGDRKTDFLKVDVDFGEAGVINLDSGEPLDNKAIEHSICKVSSGEKYDRVTVLKNLVYSYLDLPIFVTSQTMPMCLKKPTPKSKCIIFVSNRKQINNLANLQEFSNLCVYLGKHLNVYERAKSISSFNIGSKPIMIATDNSIFGAIFENVRYIFNFNPPKTKESYNTRVGFAQKGNSLCVTLYSKDQYQGLVYIIRDLVKKVSIHIVPSKEYMMKHDLKWLKKFISQLVTENGNLIAPYLPRSEEILSRYGDSVISTCANVLLRDKIDLLTESDPKEESLVSRSILSGKHGFTAVSLYDSSKQYLNDESEVKKLFARYIPDSRLSSIIGRCYKTEGGYIVDVSNKHLKNLVELSKDNPDIYVQIPTEVPKILLNDNSRQVGKVHRKGIPWNTVKIRKPPKIHEELV